MIEIVLGTSNEHKVHEMNLIAEAYDVKFIPVKGAFDPDENGETFEENALIKAMAAFKTGEGKLFMADDSGLCVDFLDGAPGIKSARFESTPERRIEKLLDVMKNANKRTAHFECHLVLVNDEGKVLHTSKGVVNGKIAHETKGEGGFGYDPVFILDETGRTMAEISEEEKNIYSHRGRALKNMLDWLKTNIL